MKPEIDDVSGQHTTGHEWNGIKELNTPMPWAFRIWLWISIAVAVVMWLLYPSFPYVTDYAEGVVGYSSRIEVDAKVAEGQALKAESFAPFETMDVASLAEDASLRANTSLRFQLCFATIARRAMGAMQWVKQGSLI